MPLHFPRFYGKDRHASPSSNKRAKEPTAEVKPIAAPTDEPESNKDTKVNTDAAPGSPTAGDDGREVFHTPLTEPIDKFSGLEDQLAKTSIAPEEQREIEESPRKTPFAHPNPTSTPVARPGLSTDQAAKYALVHEEISKWVEQPPKNPHTSKPVAPLTEDEQMWLTRECLLRYLRASSWSTTHAVKRIIETMLWRRDFKVSEITADSVSVEAETGKMVVLGYDISARPCLYMNPGKQNTQKSEAQIKHLVYMLERAIDLMPPGQETTALLINFKGATSGGSPSVGQGKQVLNILQGHYPERLGRACISDLPWYVNTFFKIISPFIDPVTREKMIFNEDLRKHIPPDQLDKEYGGEVDFVYEHMAYWPKLDELCRARQQASRKRWEEAGKQIGEYEGYLRGGSQSPLRECRRGSKDAVPVDAADGGVAPRPVGS